MTLNQLEADSPLVGGSASKRCGKCRETKALSEFSRRSSSKDGLQSQCKACNHAWQTANPEKRRDTWNRYRRSAYMKQKYGLTIEEYWSLYRRQNERCAICGVHGDDAGQHTVQQLPLHVDHDHETGAVRGLLCRLCNMGLGSFRDSREALLAALDYLDGPGAGERRPRIPTGVAVGT